MAKFTITADGFVKIVGKHPIITNRDDVDEAVVFVPVQDLAAFLEELVASSADTDEAWDFMELLRQRGAGEAA